MPHEFVRGLFSGSPAKPLATTGLTSQPVPISKPGILRDLETPRALGSDINTLAIRRVVGALPGPNPAIMTALMDFTSFRESNRGTNRLTHKFRVGPGGTVGHGGNFQVTTGTFRDLQNRNTPSFRVAKQKLKDEIGVDIDSVGKSAKEIRNFLASPINSTAAARLLFFRAPGIPNNISEPELERFYRKHFRGR